MRNPTGNVDPTSTDELFLISRNDKSLAHLLEFVDERKTSHDSAYITLIRPPTSKKKINRKCICFIAYV